MEPPLLQKLADKKMTKEALFKVVEDNFDLVPDVLSGVASQKRQFATGAPVSSWI